MGGRTRQNVGLCRCLIDEATRVASGGGSARAEHPEYPDRAQRDAVVTPDTSACVSPQRRLRGITRDFAARFRARASRARDQGLSNLDDTRTDATCAVRNQMSINFV